MINNNFALHFRTVNYGMSALGSLCLYLHCKSRVTTLQGVFNVIYKRASHL